MRLRSWDGKILLHGRTTSIDEKCAESVTLCQNLKLRQATNRDTIVLGSKLLIEHDRSERNEILIKKSENLKKRTKEKKLVLKEKGGGGIREDCFGAILMSEKKKNTRSNLEIEVGEGHKMGTIIVNRNKICNKNLPGEKGQLFCGTQEA